MRFYKYQNLGNDFVILDNRDEGLSTGQNFVERICDRHFGVGADGILYLAKDNVMRIFNPDGSEAEMCGNGALCMARFMYDNGYAHEKEISLQTKGGEVRLFIEGNKVREIMPTPEVKGMEEIEVRDKRIEAMIVSVGNPHAVIFDQSQDVIALAPEIEGHRMFPEGTNVEFARVVSPSFIELIVLERGAGFTLACGTGACASVLSGHILNKLGDRVTVSLPGGKMAVETDGKTVSMSSEPREVFRGVIENDL